MSFLFIFTMIGLTQAQSVIANWNFNDLVAAPNTSTVITADVGTGTLYLDGTHGSSTWSTATPNPQLTAFTGYAAGDAPSGMAIALANSSSNGQGVVFVFSTEQMENIQLAFIVRGSTSGFTSHAWSYSVDNGTTFVPIDGNNTASATGFPVWQEVDFSSVTGLNNQETVYLKLVVDGCSSASGNNRIDNFTITGTAMVALSTPVVTTLPTAGVGNQNALLGTVALSGGAAEYNGTSVPGTFDWTDPTQTLTATGTASYNVTFTPTNTDEYATVQFDVDVTVVGACVATIPWVYGFEDGTHAAAVAGCFSQTGVSGSSSWVYNKTYTSYNRTPRSGLMNATLQYGNTRWLFREVYFTPGTYRVSLYARQDASSGATLTVVLGTSATTTAMDNGYTIIPATTIVGGNYQLLTGTVTITTSGVYTLGIKGTLNYTPWHVSIDDIAIEDVNCLAPTIAVSNITPNSALVTITSPAESFVLEYKEATATTWNTLHVSNTTVTLTGLTDDTNYQLRVKANCGGGQSSIYATASFKTPCFPETVPFAYGFEDGTDAAPVDLCISQIGEYGSYSWVYNTSNTSYNRTPRSGSVNATLYYSNTRWLFKDFSLQPGRYEFSMFARQDGSVPTNASITVKIGTEPTIAAMNAGTVVVAETGLVNGDYQELTGRINIITAGVYTIGIKGYISGSPYYISIDDISLDVLACGRPESVTASNITSNSADVTFVPDPDGEETAWVLEYKASTDADWTIMPMATTSTTLTGLTRATNYLVRVKAICSESSESAYREINFVTECGLPPTTPFYYGFENGTHGAPVDICFTQESVSGTSAWTFNKTETGYNRTPRSGEFNAYLRYSNNRWLFTEVDLQPGLHEFGIYARQDMSSGATLTVKMGTAATATAMDDGITIIDQVSVVSGDYQNFSSLFMVDTAGIYVIGINATLTGTPWYISIDDISLESITCPKPTSVTVNSVALSTANITIVPYGNETSWIVEYKKSTEETWTVRTVTNPTVNLTGLSHSTVYDLRVKAACAADDHSKYLTTQFATIYQVPFFEPFATASTPTAWTNVKVDQVTSAAGIFDFVDIGSSPSCSPKDGPYMARFNNWNYGTGTTGDLITPQINGIGAGSLIKFWMYRDGGYSSNVEGIRVMVNNAPTSEDATLLNTIHRSTNLSPTVSTAGWYQYIVRVPSTGFNRVIFEGFSAYGNNMYIDEIEVTAPYYTPVIITNGPGGNSSPAGNITVLNGTDRLINFVPSQGYRISSITVNGTEVQGPDLTNSRPFPYTLSVGIDTLYVNATYEKIPYTITPSITNYHGNLYLDNGNMPGTITPDQPTIVLHGESQIFTISVSDHFHLYELLVDGVSEINNAIAQGNNVFTYEFTDVTADHTIEAIVKIDTLAIEFNVVNGAGIINGNYVAGPTIHNIYVNYGDDFLAIMPAAPGYSNLSTTVNGQYVGAASQYQLYNIQTTQYIVLEYQANPITITTQAYGNGTITPGTTFIYDPAYVYDYVVTPATGNYVSAVLVNDVPQTIADNALYTGQLTNITEDQMIKAYFEPLTYQVTATAGVGGTVTPAGTQTYNYGATQQYVVNAAVGHTITSVEVDGVTVTVPAGATSYTYTFNNIVANHTIAATFAINTYTITATAGANGTVTPAGATTLNYNEDLTYTITPNAGYHIVDVLVDGMSVGAVSQYNFVDVQENHTISATFAINTYTITASINGNGTITPAGVTTVNHGGNQTYTITPALGSLIMDVLVDGVSQGAITSYTFTNITANHVIYVVTNTATFNITVTQPNHGTITPGSHTVLYGATPTFTVVPNTGYNVSAVQVNGSSVAITPNNIGVVTHTLNPVSANVTIAATMAIKTYTITASAGANGTITPSGTATVNYGASSQVYQFNPAAGYVVDNVTIDGIAMGALPSYQFAHVTANHTINVTFKLIECETPANTYTTLITQTTATFNWNATDAASYSVQYKKLSDANFTMVNNVNNTWLDVTGLTANTQYMWQVRSNCSATNYSEWSMVNTFVTLPSLPDAVDEYDLSNLQVYSYYSDLFIVNNGAFALESAEIFDSYGKLVYSTTLNTNSEVITLDVATGIYFVKVYTTQGAAAYKVHITK
ncbi:MAG TPA: fibronectin type III domain-containing protein [Bacteroidales bacterium]|nr:fibronectin type III domain-containing protein [Bacteroidales bacterium]HPZ03163.1 fibronectin type III domain-containing protein [Bacteroidales bacterium]HQB74590.1 fibronectin type III domain-containing protein [Bacteroidales bacterium]